MKHTLIALLALVLAVAPVAAQQKVIIQGTGGGGATVTNGKLDVNISGGGGAAVTIADGADVTQGAIADAVATAGGVGTVSAKLRTLTSSYATYGQTGATADTLGVQILCANETSYVAAGNGQVKSVLCQGPLAAATGTAVPAWATYLGASDGTNLIGLKETGNALWTLPTGNTTTGTASASFTSGTTAYAANDVVGAASSNAALTFTAICPASSNIMITGIQMEVDSSAVISGQTGYTLYLYNVTPPSAINDSSQWDIPSGDRASFLGGPLTTGTVIDVGSTLYVEANGINKQVQCAASGNLFGYLVSLGAYTPTAQVYKVTIHATPL